MKAGNLANEVVLVGSANCDYVVGVDRLPHPGETVMGERLVTGPGGKGLNQAVAAARAGAAVRFVGALGTDEAARMLLATLRGHGIKVSDVRMMEEAPTGAALIYVASDGENSIVVAPGANGALTSGDVSSAIVDVTPGSLLLTQMETPPAVVAALARTSWQIPARFVLNLAPYRETPSDVLAAADPLVVNEHEAALLLGSIITDPARAALELASKSRSAVITLGAGGAVVAWHGLVSRHPAPEVEVVDTTGAGDAFVGVMTAALAAGASLERAVAQAVGAAARSTTRLGAQASWK